MPTSSNAFSSHAAALFAEKWQAITSEKQYAQSFWRDFFSLVCGIPDLSASGIEFEHPVRSVKTNTIKFVDVFWPGVLLVEHKSAGKNLDAADEQADEYLRSLPEHTRPPVRIVSDFARLRITDLASQESLEFPLGQLPEHLARIERIVQGGGERAAAVEAVADKAAAKLMAGLFTALSADGYGADNRHDASVLLVRLLFIMFGDDTGMWRDGSFTELLEQTREDGSDLGATLMRLFDVLNTPMSGRSGNLPAMFARFPYANGGLFTDQIAYPDFTATMRAALLRAAKFNWSAISPAIFGSLFQSVKSKEERHSRGEHYTSETNILRVIRPLFLDEYNERMLADWGDRRALARLRDDLGALRYLDPACGCGNFLVVAYRELRALETKILARLLDLEVDQPTKPSRRGRGVPAPGALTLDGTDDLRVRLDQFHGIEIEEWPSQIARVAMFMADHQANLALEQITGNAPTLLPLSDSARIVHGNALTIPWTDVCPPGDDVIVFGNPPFLGRPSRSPEQRKEHESIWRGVDGAGNLDFVTCWFLLAGRYLEGTRARAAFVSTNSITQGVQPAVLWGQLYPLGMGVDFAYRTFPWRNGAGQQAAVHCVIIGFSANLKPTSRPLWTGASSGGKRTEATNINAYLVDAQDVLIPSRMRPVVQGCQGMENGSQPTDGGFLTKIDAASAARIRQSDPVAAKYLRRLVGSEELINGQGRYCLWLKDVDPRDVSASRELRDRIESVRQMRLSSDKPATRKDAATPHLFQADRQPTSDYLAVPIVYSENYVCVPAKLLSGSVIANNRVQVIPDATSVTFGVMASSAFDTWSRTVSGRMKSDLSLTAGVTYNNFPFPDLDDSQRAHIADLAQTVLDARAAHPDATLADLYSAQTFYLYTDLKAAHDALDIAVLAVYGLSTNATDQEVLKALFDRYAMLTAANRSLKG